MNERQLKIFKTVCSHGNMTLAAKELYISQSSVSQTITEIERQYDILLFERIGKKLYITKSGEKLLFFANQILSLHKNLYSSLKSDSIHEELRIGATITIGTYLLPSIISQFNNITENGELISQSRTNTPYLECAIHYTDQVMRFTVTSPFFIAEEIFKSALDVEYLQQLKPQLQTAD